MEGEEREQEEEQVEGEEREQEEEEDCFHVDLVNGQIKVKREIQVGDQTKGLEKEVEKKRKEQDLVVEEEAEKEEEEEEEGRDIEFEVNICSSYC